MLELRRVKVKVPIIFSIRLSGKRVRLLRLTFSWISFVRILRSFTFSRGLFFLSLSLRLRLLWIVTRFSALTGFRAQVCLRLPAWASLSVWSSAWARICLALACESLASGTLLGIWGQNPKDFNQKLSNSELKSLSLLDVWGLLVSVFQAVQFPCVAFLSDFGSCLGGRRVRDLRSETYKFQLEMIELKA